METIRKDERRKHPRLNKRCTVSYCGKNNCKDYDMSHTKDISFGGMGFTSSQKFEKGEQLDIIIRFPFVDQPVKMSGKVVQCRERSKIIYDIGVKFLYLAPEILDRFKKYQKKMQEELDRRFIF
jgi:hypothetical protein